MIKHHKYLDPSYITKEYVDDIVLCSSEDRRTLTKEEINLYKETIKVPLHDEYFYSIIKYYMDVYKFHREKKGLGKLSNIACVDKFFVIMLEYIKHPDKPTHEDELFRCRIRNL